MIRLTNFADYAVVLMSALAKDNDRRASAQELASITGVPAPTVSKVLNVLGQADLLKSHRGLKGGFSLSRSADDISVAEIIEAVDGPICMTECANEDEDIDCSLSDICKVRSQWLPINRAVRETLDAISLAFIAQSENEHTVN